jgi:hypothetical protein
MDLADLEIYTWRQDYPGAMNFLNQLSIYLFASPILSARPVVPNSIKLFAR